MAAAARKLPEYETFLVENDQSGTTLTGVLVNKKSSGLSGPRGCIPIMWCYCVHDSPDSPCPCNFPPIIWLPEKWINWQRPSGRRTDDGHPITSFGLDPKTRVYLDETRRPDAKDPYAGQVFSRDAAGEFKKSDGEVWIQQFTPVLAGALDFGARLIASSEPLQTIIAKKTDPKKWSKVFGAFTLGWTVGEWLNEEFDLTDKISDWLIDTFGPW